MKSHALCILVTEFYSSAIIPAIIHIQNKALLIGLARTNNRRLFLFTALGYVRAKLVVYQEDYCGDLVRLEDTFSGVLPFFFHTHLLLKVVSLL